MEHSRGASCSSCILILRALQPSVISVDENASLSLNFNLDFIFSPSSHDSACSCSPSDVSSPAGVMFWGLKLSWARVEIASGGLGFCTVTVGLRLSLVSGLWRFLNIALSAKASVVDVRPSLQFQVLSTQHALLKYFRSFMGGFLERRNQQTLLIFNCSFFGASKARVKVLFSCAYETYGENKRWPPWNKAG